MSTAGHGLAALVAELRGLWADRDVSTLAGDAWHAASLDAEDLALGRMADLRARSAAELLAKAEATIGRAERVCRSPVTGEPDGLELTDRQAGVLRSLLADLRALCPAPDGAAPPSAVRALPGTARGEPPGGAGFHTVRTRSMEPELRIGDTVAFMPADRFRCDDLYVLDFGHGRTVMRCMSFHTKERGPHIRCAYDCPAFEPHALSPVEFGGYVVGRVFAIVKVKNPELMERAGVSFSIPADVSGNARP